MGNKHESWMTTKRERIGYLSYFTGQNILYILVTMFLSTYLLFLGINPLKSAGVLLAVKIWDGVNDAIFGCLMDKVKFKNGKKFLPWLRIAVVMLPIVTVLLFAVPKDASETLKLAWFALAYMLFDTSYTLCDAPAFGMITTMTDNLNERESLISYSRISGGLGMAISYFVCTLLISEYVGLNLSICALILAVAAFAFMLPCCLTGRERLIENDAKSTEKAPPIKDIFKYLGKNKFLLILFIGSFFSGGLQTANTLFVAFYLFNNSLLGLISIAVAVVPVLICALLVPKLIKKVDKYYVFMASAILTFVFGMITWAVGYGNITLYFALVVLKGIPGAVNAILLLMFTPDCVEYGKFKTGISASGIAFSVQTFMAKITSAVAGSLGLFILGLFGWKSVAANSFQDLAESGIEQTAEALNVLWMTNTLIPAIGFGIAACIWLFYRLRDKDVQAMAAFNSGKITREEALEIIGNKKFG